MLKPAKAFSHAILRRWWWLVTAVVGGALAAASLLEITPYIPWFVGTAIFLVCLLVASFLAYCDLFISVEIAKKGVSTIVLQRRPRLNMQDRIVIMNLNNQMVGLHDHDDYSAIEADYQNGVDVNDILKRDCTICGKPRNQKGGRIYG